MGSLSSKPAGTARRKKGRMDSSNRKASSAERRAP